jgi:hypothetical protein
VSTIEVAFTDFCSDHIDCGLNLSGSLISEHFFVLLVVARVCELSSLCVCADLCIFVGTSQGPSLETTQGPKCVRFAVDRRPVAARGQLVIKKYANPQGPSRAMRIFRRGSLAPPPGSELPTGDMP